MIQNNNFYIKYSRIIWRPSETKYVISPNKLDICYSCLNKSPILPSKDQGAQTRPKVFRLI